jgi:hypothetical protein
MSAEGENRAKEAIISAFTPLLNDNKLVLKRIVAHRFRNEITLDEIGKLTTIFKMKRVTCQYYYGCW